MPNMGGLDLIQKIAEESIPVLTVIMTGFGTVETAIEAMKKGAYDYILKPFKVEEVIHIVQRGLDRQRLQHENIRPQRRAVDLQDSARPSRPRCRSRRCSTWCSTPPSRPSTPTW